MVAVALALGITGGIVASLFVAWHVLSYWQVDVKCQRPKFQLIRTIGQRKKWLGLKTVPAVEIRRYAPYLVAQVILQETDMRKAMNNGFRQVAGFIFGDNIASQGEGNQKVAMTAPVTLEVAPSNQKIAMTSPVTSELLGNKQYLISFVMPSKYTKQTLPKPVNQNVKIKQVPGHVMAAMAWNGSSPNEEETNQKAEQLKQFLAAQGIITEGNTHLYQYHPPFSPPWMRVNEVLFTIPQ